MTSITGATSNQYYFQSSQTKAATGGAGKTGQHSGAQPAASSKQSTESAGTRNTDGTYGPHHTINPPQSADQAQELAEAQTIISA